MRSFVSSDQDIRSKKSLSLNSWVVLFILLQVIITLCDYSLKKTGIAGDFAPLYTRIITSALMLFFTLRFLASQGVSFRERLGVYKKNSGRDFIVSLGIAGMGLFLGYLMLHFNVHGQVLSVNSVVLGNLLLKPDGGLSYGGLVLVFFSYCLLAPVMEEVFFRRLLYVSLRQRYSLLRSLIISSMLFGLIHPDAVLFTVLFGLMQCIAYERFGRVSINITSHLMFNSAIIVFSAFGR